MPFTFPAGKTLQQDTGFVFFRFYSVFAAAKAVEVLERMRKKSIKYHQTESVGI